MASSCAAGEQPAAAVLDDPRVVAGRQTGGSCALREREQLGEAEAAVARDARVRRLAAGVAAHEGVDDRAPELLAQVERDVRDAERVTRRPRRQHRVGRAARALRARPVRVEPEPQRDADRVGARSKQRDGAVDAAAHRNRDARRRARRAERRADGVRERVGRRASRRRPLLLPAGSARRADDRARARPPRRSGRRPPSGGRTPSRLRERSRRRARPWIHGSRKRTSRAGDCARLGGLVPARGPDC